MKTTTQLCLIFSVLFLNWFNSNKAKAQNIGINGTGVNAHASALLDVDATGSLNKGLLIPRIPLTAINAAAPVTSPATSLLIYNTATASTGTNAVTPGYYYWDGTKWVRFAYTPNGSASEAWTVSGNGGTSPSANFLGTTDATDLVFKASNLERMRILNANGSVGIGTNNPLAKLHVIGVGNNTFNNGLTIQSPNAVQSLDVLPGYALTNNTPAGIQENITMTLRSSGSLIGNMAFATGNDEKMRLTTVGNLGIGTTSPSQKLHINEGNILVSNTSNPITSITLANYNTGVNSSPYISFVNQAGNQWNQYLGGPTGYAGVQANAMEWWEYPVGNSSGTCCLARLKIQPNVTGLGYATVVIDNVGQMFGNGWAQPSDKTLKTNIKPLTNALDKISKLGGYSYNFTKESNLDDGKVHIGVIAQEVEAVLPEAVSQFPQANYKAINYDALIPLQIEAIKELREENIQQKSQITELLKRIEALEKK